MSGPPRKPTAWRRADGNRGKKAWNHAEPVPPEGVPDCPDHLGDEARSEWHRLVETLVGMGVITIVDRAVLAAYCQAYGRWVEAEERLRETPLLIKTPSGYVQQSPWLNVANRQMELMGRYMAEIGLTPASRSRIVALRGGPDAEPLTIRIIYQDTDGTLTDAQGNEVHEPRGNKLALPGTVDKL